MESEHKLRKLEQFRRRVPHASESALSAIIKDIRVHGIPELHLRKDFYNAKLNQIGAPTPYGPLNMEINVQGRKGPMTLHNLNPLAMLYKAYHQGGGFTNMMDHRHSCQPSSPGRPWKLILYADEITPGNPLATENKRKCWAVYASFVELGGILLQKETSWLCISIQRSSVIDKMEAGISQLMKEIVKIFFISLDFDSRAGLRLSSSTGSSCMLYLDLGFFIQDGAAHKLMWHMKGESGFRFCSLCLNVISRRSKVVQDGLLDDFPGLVCENISNENLVFATDQDVRATQLRLRAASATHTKANFDMLQKATSFNYEPHGILQDDELFDIVKPISQYCHDPMHCLVVGGVFNTCMFLLLSALKKLWSNIYERLSDYCKSFKFPGRVSNISLQSLFSKKREASNNENCSFKCTASEALSVYVLVALFVANVVISSGNCMSESKAFLALADLIDMFQIIPLGKILPADLHGKVNQFLDLCCSAGWHEFMHPKFHWLRHMHEHLNKFGILPSCFTHERKHKLIKRYMTNIFNTRSYETSILQEVACHELADLQILPDSNHKPVLLEQRQASAKLLVCFSGLLDQQLDGSLCFTSAVLCLPTAGRCYKNDIVILCCSNDLDAAKILFHVNYDGVCYSFVSMMEMVSFDRSLGIGVWNDVGTNVLIRSADIVCSCIYAELGHSKFRVLVPLRCRC